MPATCQAILDFFHFYFSLILRIFLDILLLALSPILFTIYCFQSGENHGGTSLFSSKGKQFQSIFITGASSGIGKSIAIELSGKDVTLFLCGRNEKRLNKVVALCKASMSGSGVVIPYICDVTDTSTLQEVILDADGYKPLDCIIANAG